MHHELVFNRRGCHIFALAGLEQVFHPARDVQVALRVDVALVTGFQPAVFGEGLPGLFGFFVVTLHQCGTVHLHFAGFGVDAVLHTVVHRAHGALLVFAGFGDV